VTFVSYFRITKVTKVDSIGNQQLEEIFHESQ